MDEKYFVASLRRTWDGLAGGSLNQAGKEKLTAEEIRLFVRGYLEGEARMTRIVTQEWQPLPEEVKRRLLVTAFPDEETDSRPEEPPDAGDEAIAPSRP